uniref:Cytochrome c biogenesis protein CcsA n=1 Tax=Astrosyne radiata TaxID=1158023 RepID=A0A2U9NTI3_9STRA|nr:cytochrome c heme attachment protein [Astrosyne radiata]AWT40379.1 cytochrome c heme attachment protein [Astrosyne radiata]
MINESILKNIQILFSTTSCLSLGIAFLIFWINFLIIYSVKITKIINTILSYSHISIFLVLFFRWFFYGYFPLSNLYESLLLIVWNLLTIYLYCEYKTKTSLISVALLPIILLVNSFSNISLPSDMQLANSLVPSLQSNWLVLHVFMMLSSYSFLITGSALCILFLIISKFQFLNQDFLSTYEFVTNSSFPFVKVILSKKFVNPYKFTVPSALFKLLSNYARRSIDPIYSNELNLYSRRLCDIQILKRVDEWSYKAIGFGFPTLVVGIISGAIWANEAWGSFWSWDPKEVWALITLFVFTSFLHARLIYNWNGTNSAFLGSCGFFIVWICYLGVNFLGQGLHNYGWLL